MSKFHSARTILSANIIRNRKLLGLSQEALAIKAGIHRTYIGAVERCERNISVDNIEKLANALGCDVAELLTKQ